MEGTPRCIDPENEYPILIIPKKWTTLETSDVSTHVYIDARVTTPDTDGKEACLYAGYLNIKVIDSYDVNVQNMRPQEITGIEDLPIVVADQERIDNSYDGSSIWNSPRGPFINNNYKEDTRPTDVHYSISHQSHTKHVTVKQHNTYITQNVYNFNDAVHYAHHTETTKKIQIPEREIQSENNIFNQLSIDDACNYEVVLSPFEEEVEDIQNANNQALIDQATYTEQHPIDKRSTYTQHDKDSEALKQLMSSDIQSVSKQRKTILYLGPAAHRGQTIQQIAYSDPALECSVPPNEIDNEVIIESSDEPIPPNLKKYQCAKCQQIFDQLADFREHMGRHAATARPARYKARSRSPADTLVKYTCPECGKTLKDKDKLDLHRLGHGDPDLECDKCCKVFASKLTLRVHQKIHNRKYRCHCCTNTYDEARALRTHVAKFHHQFMCDACQFVSNSNAELLTHRKVHQAIYTYDQNAQNDSSGTEYGFCEAGPLLSPNTLRVRDWVCQNYEVTVVDKDETNVKENQNVDTYSISSEAKEESLSQENLDKQDENKSQIDENSGVIENNNQCSTVDDKPVDQNDDHFDENGSEDGDESQIYEDSDEDWHQYDEDMSQYDDDDDYEMDEDEKGLVGKCNDNNNDSVIAKAIGDKAFLASKTKKSKRFNKVCEVCLKRFDRMSDLKRHLIEHVIRSTLAKLPLSPTGILNIRCEVCHAQPFHRVDEYKAHLREHAKLTLYRCTFCDKSFSDSSNFSKHKKIHGATYFQCDLCQRKFNSKQMIARHIEYHNKHSPLPCPYCDKKFHFSSMLNKHIKVSHTKKAHTKFRCRFCLKHFATLKGKWDHEWKVHKARKMIVDCLLCGAKYRKYSELKRHCHDKHEYEIPSAKHLLSDDDKNTVRYKKPF